MKALKVGILGATGAVGEQMRIVLTERKFPISELRLFGSARSAGTEVEFDGKMLKVVEATPEAGSTFCSAPPTTTLRRSSFPMRRRRASSSSTIRAPSVLIRKCRS